MPRMIAQPGLILAAIMIGNMPSKMANGSSLLRMRSRHIRISGLRQRREADMLQSQNIGLNQPGDGRMFEFRIPVIQSSLTHLALWPSSPSRPSPHQH